MKISANLMLLHENVNKMGSNLISNMKPLDYTEEIEIIDEEIQNPDVLEVRNGVYFYKNQHVILYIKNVGGFLYKLIREEEVGPRFHLTECQTISAMKRKRIGQNTRFDARYFVTKNTTGRFQVEGYDYFGKPSEAEVKLLVCRNCLKKLNYDDFKNFKLETQKVRACRNFIIDQFFKKYQFAGSQFQSFPKRKI